MKKWLILMVVFFLSYHCFSQRNTNLDKNTYLIENYVSEDYKRPDSILFIFRANNESDDIGKKILSKIRKKARKEKLKYRTKLEVYEWSTDYNKVVSNYKSRYLAIIYFGNRHTVIPHESGVPELREVHFNFHYKLIDNKNDKILFHKTFNSMSNYYIRNKDELAIVIFEELNN